MTNISLHIPNEKHPTTVCACMCVWFHGIWGTDGVIVKETELICLTKKAKHRFWSSLDLKIQSPNKVQNKSNFHTSSCSHMGLENNQYTNFNHYCMSAESNNQKLDRVMKAVILYIWRTQGQEAEFICLDAINMTVYMHIFTFITSLSYVCVCIWCHLSI